MKSIFPTAVQHAADVVRHIFQIPLVHEPVDLPRFFVSFAGGVRVVNDAYEPYPPGGEQTVDVFFHQFQFTGEPRLCLAQHDIEFVLLRVPQQTVELRAPPVRACIVVVTINVENVPSLFHRILQQHRFLVLNASEIAGSGRLVPVFLRQSAVERRFHGFASPRGPVPIILDVRGLHLPLPGC